MKFENIDLVDTLRRIMDIHTQNYKEDFELDDEMAELLFHTARKLEGITDEAFDQLYIAPDSMMDD